MPVTADDEPELPDLTKLDFRQIVDFLEAQPVEAQFAISRAEDIRQVFPQFSEVDVRDVVIDGPHGGVAGRVYTGERNAGTGFVWVHGGAFIGGDLDMSEAHWVSLALAANGVAVLSLDYHKALRGVHYPIPSDDVLAGWLWATKNADVLGTKPGDLQLGGASAGGNLVAGVTKRLRDGAGQLPASLVLVYPVLHSELPALSAELRKKLDIEEPPLSLPAATVREFNWQYAGSEGVLGDPYAFPANGPLEGLPPIYIVNSDVDYLRASGEAYGEDLRSAGVDVTVEMEPGTHHGHLNRPDEEEASATIDRLTAWLHRDRQVKV